LINFQELKTTNLSAVLTVMVKLSQGGINVRIGSLDFGRLWVITWFTSPGPTIIAGEVKDDNILGALNRALDEMHKLQAADE